uniref:tannase/feruloyl esterase family alpha/beta hydrolase n=1 Tax=Altererythrobacter segetis TaxID=1104773 RepID=UPI001FAFB7BB|nr:tannase/feruloyl esterase family alpha/beta hydrolase [Altererythrobacter segetis]
MKGAWPEADTRIDTAEYLAAGTQAPAGPPGVSAPAVTLPAHCEIVGSMRHRKGVDGQNYALRFHVRLPEQWNGRLLFEGGGGLDGNLGSALGMIGFTKPPAISEGFAVVSQDSGHDARANNDPAHGGDAAFGFDPQARADYGGASIKPVALAAKALAERFYGNGPRYSYFVGCSKGGQEGMMAAQRYPTLFDGIVSGAPGFSLPRAALAEAWDTQQFAAVVRAKGEQVTPATLTRSFSGADLDLVRGAVLASCDADDGLRDGIVGAFRQCTSAKVLPELKRLTCGGAKQSGCLIPAQVEALERIHDGPRNSRGEPLYAGFPWDGGWSGRDWRGWKIGAADGSMPSLNVAMGSIALAAVFSTPPTAPQDRLAYDLGFDFDRDAPKIYATGGAFRRSAWQDIGARSADLSAFRRRGGRMIVYQGASDPVFSVTDTLNWWDEVNARENGNAAQVVRVFPVAGMNHCGGGPSTDQFDAFTALLGWVEHGQAPDRIVAASAPGSPWPGRTRPLCPYPSIARPKSPDADPENAESFKCVRS